MQTAYIGMGGNIASWAGTPDATLAAAAVRLEALGQVTQRSSLYSTEPVGFAEQPRFLNAVVELQTELEPRDLLNRLLSIEAEFGRDRASGFPNGPRTLDLDIVLYDDLKIEEPGLAIPHPRFRERGFVLAPLCEIAPHRVDAESGRTMSQLLDRLNEMSESGANAVFPIESGTWHAGPGSNRAASGRP